MLALPIKEIARELGLSPEAVKWHLRNVFAKLGVGTRYQALSLLRERR
nr:helix-turn-helix transcriptional regulator [Variovorax sp. PBS-H4]